MEKSPLCERKRRGRRRERERERERCMSRETCTRAAVVDSSIFGGLKVSKRSNKIL